MNEITKPSTDAEDRMSGRTDLAAQSEQSIVLTEGPGALLQGIMALARDPSVRVDVIQSLVQMQERMEDRQAERDFAAAMKAAQAQIPRVEKRGTVDLKRKDGSDGGAYAFARLEDIDDVLRPVMDKHGFSVTFDRVSREGGGLVVTAYLSHTGGHTKTSSFPLPIDTGPGRNNLQALGSTDSYARRYLLEGFFNIVRKGRDDDGKAAGIKYIDEEQADELRALLKETGRQEGSFLDKLFAGAVRSVDEIEVGSGFLAAKSTLEGIKRQRAQKAEG